MWNANVLSVKFNYFCHAIMQPPPPRFSSFRHDLRTLRTKINLGHIDVKYFSVTIKLFHYVRKFIQRNCNIDGEIFYWVSPQNVGGPQNVGFYKKKSTGLMRTVQDS